MRNRLSTLWDGRGFDLILIGIPIAFLIAISGAAILYNVLMSFQEVDMFSLGQLIRPFVGSTTTGESCLTRKPGRSSAIPLFSLSARSQASSPWASDWRFSSSSVFPAQPICAVCFSYPG